MPDPRQLPHLLKLLEDDSEVVLLEVGKELHAWGELLKTELARLQVPPSLEQRRLLQRAMRSYSRRWLSEHWREWMQEPNEVLALEKALALLSEFLTGFMHTQDLSLLLDDLASLCRERYPQTTGRDLAQFLFKDLGLKGAHTDFNNPLHLSLVYAIRERRGIPLSLCCVYLLIGARLGLRVEGCNFPSHFLARVIEDGQAWLVDCYNSGAFVDFKVVAQMSEQPLWGVQSLLNHPAPTRAIVARALANLLQAFESEHRQEDLALMLALSEAMEKEMALTPRQMIQASDLLRDHPRFHTGDIVRVSKLGWRGVIVDFDLACKAADSWYLVHGGGARKAQPWYHIFIDRSQLVGYAAEDGLALDRSSEKVYHPMIPHFFDKFENGRFWRNLRAWPGTF